MLAAVGARAHRWAARIDPFTDVVGLARTILALATATTLFFTPSAAMFRPLAGAASNACDGVRAYGPFCVAGGHLEIARWACFAAMLVVASGWRPRFTGVVHWWIAISLQGSATIVDGGDQVNMILALLLLPVTLLDSRKWHWQRAEKREFVGFEPYRRIVALVSLALVRFQVAGIYFHAGAGKMETREWSDGTALYYWFSSPDFGAPPWLMTLLRPVLAHGTTLALFTWSVIVLELALAAGLVVPKRRRWILLAGGIALHVGIILVHGLVSFGAIMCAALLLYLHPVERELRIAERMSEFLVKRRESKRVFRWAVNIASALANK